MDNEIKDIESRLEEHINKSKIKNEVQMPIRFLTTIIFCAIFFTSCFDSVEKYKINKAEKIIKMLQDKCQVFNKEIGLSLGTGEEAKERLKMSDDYAKKIYAAESEKVKKLLVSIYKNNPKSKYSDDAIVLLIRDKYLTDKSEKVELFLLYKEKYMDGVCETCEEEYKNSKNYLYLLIPMTIYVYGNDMFKIDSYIKEVVKYRQEPGAYFVISSLAMLYKIVSPKTNHFDCITINFQNFAFQLIEQYFNEDYKKDKTMQSIIKDYRETRNKYCQ
jgi:hypothetical protein